MGRNIGPRAVVPVGGGCSWRRECTATNKVSCRLAIQVQATKNAIQRLRVERFGMRKGGRPCALSDGAAEAQDLLRLAWASCRVQHCPQHNSRSCIHVDRTYRAMRGRRVVQIGVVSCQMGLWSD